MARVLDYPKNNPQSLVYVKLLRRCLKLIGAWPVEVFGEKLHFLVRCLRICVLTEVVTMLCGKMYFVYKYSKEQDFFIVGHCYITIFMGFVGLVRTVMSNLVPYKMILKEFLMSFHLMHFKTADEYYKKMYGFINKVSYYYSIYVLILLFVGPSFFNISTVVHNYKIGGFTGSRVPNTTLEFVVYFAYPGFYPSDWFLSVTIFNIVVVYINIILFIGNVLLLILMIFQIIGHLQILRNNLRNIPKPKKRMVLEELESKKGVGAVFEIYDDEENRYVHTKLTEIVDHHRIIVKFTNKVSDFFGLMLGLNYMFELFCCGLLLLECSQGSIDSFIRFGPLTFFVFGQLVQFSCVFEIVGTVSEKIKDNVYDIPWECMDVKNQRTVCIMLNRLQTPITVTAMGMVPVGVTTMAGVLKTTFTYFTFLKSTQN